MSPWGEAPMRNYTAANFNAYVPVGGNNLVGMSIAVLSLPAGDYTGDGIVNGLDIGLWNETLGSTTVADADGNGDGIVNQADFEVWRATRTNPPANPQPVEFDTASVQPDGSFQFSFTQPPGQFFSVVATDDLTKPLKDWTPLGLVPEVSAGQYRFTDSETGGMVRKFYKVSEP